MAKKHIYIPNSNVFGKYYLPNGKTMKEKNLLNKEQMEARKRSGK